MEERTIPQAKRTRVKRWIEELGDLYWKIVADPSIPVENLDKANEIILEAIEKLRPLTKVKQ